MALGDWQRALGQLVAARAAGRDLGPVKDALAGLDLSDAERAWLHEVTESRGFALTSKVPRWWRDTRVRRSAKLTVRALGPQAEALIQDYMREVPNSTLFFVTEGLAFLEWVGARPVSSHVRAVARFEQAMWRLKQTPAPPSGGDVTLEAPLVRHPAAALIAFEAAPEDVLAALVSGLAPPEPTPGTHAILVAPGLPRAWRPATPEEAQAFRACEPAMTVHQLQSLPGVGADTVEGLLAAQALIPAGRLESPV